MPKTLTYTSDSPEVRHLTVADATLGALRSAVAWLYRLDDEDSRAAIARVGEAWVPYRTCASLYLWQGHALRRAERWEPPR